MIYNCHYSVNAFRCHVNVYSYFTRIAYESPVYCTKTDVHVHTNLQRMFLSPVRGSPFFPQVAPNIETEFSSLYICLNKKILWFYSLYQSIISLISINLIYRLMNISKNRDNMILPQNCLQIVSGKDRTPKGLDVPPKFKLARRREDGLSLWRL